MNARRIYHPYTAWECYRAGMFAAEAPDGMRGDDAKRLYADFLSNWSLFEDSLDRVLCQWPISCEHFLTNPEINRIAWLGQASACIATGLPRKYRSGFHLLSPRDQARANSIAQLSLDRYRARPVAFALEMTEAPRDRLCADRSVGLHRRIELYERYWTCRGYRSGLPDAVPSELMQERIAPSYRAVALAILGNDLSCLSLGFGAPASRWYGEIKRIEKINREVSARARAAESNGPYDIRFRTGRTSSDSAHLAPEKRSRGGRA